MGSAMTTTEGLRRQIPQEEFDYLILMYSLRNLARPRDKISALLKSGSIIRVKKGLYIFGPALSRGPYSRELLSNLIYGPSYISLEYALSYYGLIPERAETVTSVTCGKDRAFTTPVGRFTYWAVPLDYYRVGIDLVEVGEKRSFLIATREKALTDKILRDRGNSIRSVQDLEVYLLDNLRIDPGALSQLSPQRIKEISRCSRSRKLRLLIAFVGGKGGGLSHE
jgi:hypothetical protein